MNINKETDMLKLLFRACARADADGEFLFG